MALQKEVWVKDIADNLFKTQEFIMRSVNHSAFVSDAIVHLPQAGAAPTVVKNRSTFPATITERTDTEKTYSLANFSTDPIRLRNLDEIQTSYAKRQSILGEHVEKLNESIGDETANAWGVDTAARVVKTTGSAVATALAPSATGTRNALDKADIRSAAQILDNDNGVPSGNRYGLMQTDMFYQLFSDTTVLSRDFMERSSQEAGVITQLFGVNFLIRPSVNVYSAAFALKAVGAAAAATDMIGCVIWQQSFVSNAKGDIRVYANENVAEHYGSVFSAEVEHGASLLRTDEKGVVAIVQQ